MPVFLSPDSLYPSGHFPRGTLEGKTTDSQLQRWFEVEVSNQRGWIPEAHVLTPLKMAQLVRTMRSEPARSVPRPSALTKHTIASGTRLVVRAHRNHWYKVTKENSAAEFWLPGDALRPEPNQLGLGWNKVRLHVMTEPKKKSWTAYSLPPFQFVRILSRDKEWVKIASFKGIGYAPRASLVTNQDLQEGHVMAIRKDLFLRSTPRPFAEQLDSVGWLEPMPIKSQQDLTWGLVKLREVGEVWWPIAEETLQMKTENKVESIKVKELFSRKIFDMAASPAVPNLKFVSARGVFKSLDGELWIRLPEFKDQNFPIAIASSGAVFIGPFVSDDHGETFQNYVRWDSLVATLKAGLQKSVSRMQILEVHPLDAVGNRLRLVLEIGQAKPISVLTPNQGQNWFTESAQGI